MSIEEILESDIVRVILFQGSNRDGIRNRLDYATRFCQSQNFIRTQPDINTFSCQNNWDLVDKLGRQLLLAEIIVRLDQHRKQPPPRMRSKGWQRAESLLLLVPIFLENNGRRLRRRWRSSCLVSITLSSSRLWGWRAGAIGRGEVGTIVAGTRVVLPS